MVLVPSMPLTTPGAAGMEGGRDGPGRAWSGVRERGVCVGVWVWLGGKCALGYGGVWGDGYVGVWEREYM